MIARLVNSAVWQLLPTWSWELSAVSMVVLGVARLTGTGLVEALTALAVLLTFAHVQVAARLEEADAARPLPAVHCRAMLDRYLVAKEACWVAVFALVGAWPAIAGCVVFAVYPWWRRIYRASRRRL